jgi:peptidoglycan hydrolase-like protein with peptidoglycan-binding domain
VQIALLHFGFDPGPTDGAPGNRTTAAVTRYQNASGFEPTGNPKDITAQLAVALTGDGFTALTT